MGTTTTQPVWRVQIVRLGSPVTVLKEDLAPMDQAVRDLAKKVFHKHVSMARSPTGAEAVRILDHMGQEVLRFTYDDMSREAGVTNA